MVFLCSISERMHGADSGGVTGVGGVSSCSFAFSFSRLCSSIPRSCVVHSMHHKAVHMMKVV